MWRIPPVHVSLSPADLSPVTSVSADYNCANASAVASWSAVFGAKYYRATAVDQSGTTVSCTSTVTTCMLTNLSCGKDYMVWVTAISNNCESTSSITAFFQTGEWAPPSTLMRLQYVVVYGLHFASVDKNKVFQESGCEVQVLLIISRLLLLITTNSTNIWPLFLAQFAGAFRCVLMPRGKIYKRILEKPMLMHISLKRFIKL